MLIFIIYERITLSMYQFDVTWFKAIIYPQRPGILVQVMIYLESNETCQSHSTAFMAQINNLNRDISSQFSYVNH
jgi:hypothetical protein